MRVFQRLWFKVQTLPTTKEEVLEMVEVVNLDIAKKV